MIATNEMEKSKICGGGLNTSRSPPHPPSKEVAIPDCTQKGLEKIIERWHCSSQERRLSGGSEAPRFLFASSRHTLDQLIPLHISLTPLISCPKVGTFGYQDHREKRYVNLYQKVGFFLSH